MAKGQPILRRVWKESSKKRRPSASTCAVSGAPLKKPYVEAVADRDANRITVKTKNVSALVLYLNDALLDLDKDFTIVLNGKAVTEKRQRNFYEMTEWMFTQFDPNVIWTSHYRTAVEKEDPAGSKSGEGSDGGDGGER